jgi:hypothetical protein
MLPMFSAEFLRDLRNPPKCFRPIPFWSWNEDLSVEETRRQIAEMDRVGIGGYFMHARGGLQTEYMGEDWMANIAAGIEEGEARDMGAWAYDENGWPSGFGDGKVNGKGLAFQQKYLRWEEVEEKAEAERTITHVRLADGRLLRFYFDVNPFYVDTLDATVTKDFLTEIYEPYAHQFGKDFGRGMPGFFTDEPQVSRNGIPWSFILPDTYQAAYDEDLLTVLPSLFLEVGDFRRTRYRFWKLVRDMFTDNFTRPIYEWLEEHGGELTGHMVLEETLHSQITSNGAVMPHYEFFHKPGMDWLCRHIDPPTTPLQVASVAHQLDKPLILSETFALTGWNVSFDELKWMYEWQMVRGITQLCQHLEGYSLRGIRKRDYPPSLFYQQPWWDRYRFFNDAMTRIGMVLAKGQAEFGVLVIHPQTSAWLHFDHASNAGLNDLNGHFMELTHALERAQVPFHYGDERILQRHGNVAGASLKVGLRTYGAILVPSVDTLASETVALLNEFVANGGTLIWTGKQPELVDGATCPDLASLTTQGTRASDFAAAIAAIPSDLKPLSITDADGATIGAISATFRDMPEGGRFVFLANREQGQGFAAVVRCPGASAARFVAETGEIEPVVFSTEGDEVVIPFQFVEGGSLALFVSDDPGAYASAEPAAPRTPLAAEDLAGDWQLELVDPNSLTLDTCTILFDGEVVGENEHISVVQWRALQLERPVDIELRFTVKTVAGYTPPADAALVMETPDQFTVTVNGKELAKTDLGHYRDMSFRKIDLEGSLRDGTNEIVLKTRFTQSPEIYAHLRRARVFEAEKNKLTYDSEIEAIYLIGSFGVATPGEYEALPREAMRYAGEFLLAPVPEQVTIGDLTPQGLPFFNGVLRLTKAVSIDKTTGRSFQFSKKMAHIVDLAVNGQALGEWFWRPFSCPIPDGVLQAGENELTLTLTGGLRNLMGPHHLEEGESYAVGPATFFKEPNIWGSGRWNDAYCFMPFGLQP